jgi:hypothetical protein
MATQKQIDANIRNAQKSTGPTSDEGKAVSRLNAVTHGLTATLPEALNVSRDDVDHTKAKWVSDWRPHGSLQNELVETLAIECVKMERSRDYYFTMLRKFAGRARDQWDVDRRNEAEEIAKNLKKNPSLTISRLEILPQGCDWLINRWLLLEENLTKSKVWTDDQYQYMLDLRGIDPKLRSDKPDDEASYEDNLEMIKTVLEQLQEQRELAQGHDDSEREKAEQSFGAEFSPEGLRFDRYERAAQRRFDSALKQLLKCKNEQILAPSAPKPAPSTNTALKPLQQLIEQVATVEKVAPAVTPAPVPKLAEMPEAKPAQRQNHKGMNRKQRRKQAAMERRAG